MNAMSAKYRICVRCGRAMVQSSGVGRSTCMNPLPLREPTLDPNGMPTRSAWEYTPNFPLNSLPGVTMSGCTESRVYQTEMLREKDGEKEVGGEGISLTNQTMTRSPAAIFFAEDHILGGRPLFVALPGPSWRRTDELKFSQPSSR